jgi:hypothetical protein
MRGALALIVGSPLADDAFCFIARKRASYGCIARTCRP